MTYAEALARLLALRGGEHAGMRPGLERIETLLDALGNPEQRYTLVQVGGTNGKGSTAAMLAAILKAAGRRVGLYTSPHLVSFRERIRVDGEAIAEDDVADGFDALATLVARVDATMFEATTALALDHFAREAVEVAVLEVGLGGRLDATTVGGISGAVRVAGAAVQAWTEGAGADAVAGVSRRGEPGEITLDVRHEHRHSRRRQLLGQELERPGLAGAGGSGNQAVPVEHGQGDAHLGLRHRNVVAQRGSHDHGRVGEAVARSDGVLEVGHITPRSA